MVGKIDSHANNQICSIGSRATHGRRPTALDDLTLSRKNSVTALIDSAIATVLMGFARFADNRYDSSRSCVVKGKLVG